MIFNLRGLSFAHLLLIMLTDVREQHTSLYILKTYDR